MMNKEQIRKYLVANILDKLVLYIVEDEGCEVSDAMAKIYESPIINWLENPDDDLRSHSPAYVYELFKRNAS